MLHNTHSAHGVIQGSVMQHGLGVERSIQPQPIGPVLSAMTDLESAVEQLHLRIGNLENMLQPILRLPPASRPGKEDSPEESMLHADVQRKLFSVNNAIDRLGDLASRVTL